MNFGEWTENRRNRRRGRSFLTDRNDHFQEWSEPAVKIDTSFENHSNAPIREGSLAGMADTKVEQTTYSPLKGLAGGLQKGLTNIAKVGGSAVAMAEDIQYFPLEVVTGREFGELSDNGFMNRWNDSIHKAADAVEDYYADNIAAGGKTAELLDKSVSKIVSLLPSIAVDYFMPGAGVAAELGNAAANSMPGIENSFRTVTEKLVKDPKYWLSVAGTMGENYEDAMDELEDPDFGSWVNALAQSAIESLYKEAINTSEVFSDDFAAMGELIYEMFGQEAGEDKQSFLNELAKRFFE